MDGLDRRAVVRAALTMAVAAGAPRAASAAATPVEPLGRPGDFNFLTGAWRIHNRMIRPGAKDEWIEFPGEATVWSILGGTVSIEELRIPARDFSGMGLRLLDAERRIWSDHWVNARSGVVSVPGQEGVFRDGVGTFGADDMDGDRPIKIRGVWDRITPVSCRWFQGVSRDGGRTWFDSWFMDWRRA